MTRARAAAWWAIPSLICLAVHWLGFLSWFRADDFAWLGNLNRVYSAHDLLAAIFSPQAQGTIRPWSERIFFMAGYGLFGLHSLPFRIVIFGTQFVDLALAAWIGWKLSGSRAAGFCAAILWTINSASMEPLGWACVYNEVMCAAFLMGAFALLLRYIETGDRRYLVWQWVVFLLGFGALELNVVYPALAAVYTWLCARRYFRGVLPMAGVSAAYALIHAWAAKGMASGVYAMHYDGSVLKTLTTYLTWSLGPVYMELPRRLHHWVGVTSVSLVGLALLVFAIRRARESKPAALFPIAWYLIVIAPVLPLRDHLTEYYPYIPEIGLAWLGGWALADGWRAGAWKRPAAVALALLYTGLELPRLFSSAHWQYDQTIEARDLMEGVAAARQLHPKQAILLYRVNGTQYTNVVRDSAFPVFGMDQVYLAPGSEGRIGNPEGGNPVSDYVLAPSLVTRALDRDELVVYDVSGPVLRNITSKYAAMPLAKSLPSHINVADPLTAHLLGPEWLPAEVDHRWMGKSATVKLAGPSAQGESLYLLATAVEGGARTLTVFADDVSLGSAATHPGSFETRFALPDSLVGKDQITVRVEVDRTSSSAGDPRALGLAFGTFAVR